MVEVPQSVPARLLKDWDLLWNEFEAFLDEFFFWLGDQWSGIDLIEFQLAIQLKLLDAFMTVRKSENESWAPEYRLSLLSLGRAQDCHSRNELDEQTNLIATLSRLADNLVVFVAKCDLGLVPEQERQLFEEIMALMNEAIMIGWISLIARAQYPQGLRTAEITRYIADQIDAWNLDVWSDLNEITRVVKAATRIPRISDFPGRF